MTIIKTVRNVHIFFISAANIYASSFLLRQHILR